MTRIDGRGQHTATLISDQSFDHPQNKALLVRASFIPMQSDGGPQNTQRPVRVIRGPNRTSKYAPEVGYRYDSLYKVVQV